ncbi:MAG TPA: hypothetical protein VI814_06050 [Candidatus Limnocylindria bacterium]
MGAGIATLLRAVLALAVFGGAATAVVAPSLDLAQQRAASVALNHPSATPRPAGAAPELDYETLLLACLDTWDADSDACAYAQAKSGLGRAEFRSKILARLYASLPTAEPTAGPTAEPTTTPSTDEFWVVFEKCLDARDVASPLCKLAQNIIGMSDADFLAKFQRYLAERDRTPTPKPTPKPTQQDFWTVFYKCLDTRDVTSAICKQAQRIIGFNDADFRAKFERYLAERDGKTPTPKPTTADFWTVFDRCLDTRNVTSAVCKQAQQIIGFSDADFLAKFQRYLAERDAKSATPKPTPTAKPTPTPTATTVSTALLDTLIQACVATHDVESRECNTALAYSGLAPAAFWSMVWTKYGYF